MSKKNKRKDTLAKENASPDKIIRYWSHALLPKAEELTAEQKNSLARCEKIVWPDTFRILRKDDLKKCRASLREVSLSENLETIEDGAFAKCRFLKSVVIPESVKTIGPRAFEGCVSLEKIVIPRGVEGIGNLAFKDCGGLKKFSLQNCGTKLGERILQGCTAKVEVRTGPSGSEVRDPAFRERLGLPEPSDFVIANGELKEYTGRDNPIRIPEGVKTVSLRLLEGVPCENPPLVVILPQSFRNLKGNYVWSYADIEAYGSDTTPVELVFPEDILERPQILNAFTLEKILERRGAKGVSLQERARLFLTFKGTDYLDSEEFLLSEAGVEAILTALDGCSLKTAAPRAAEFFYRHPLLFSSSQKRQLSRLIAASRKAATPSQSKDLGDLPWPEPVMDALLDRSGFDPESSVFSEARRAGSSRKARPVWVKGALLPYIVDAPSGWDGEIKAPTLSSKAEFCAAKLNPQDLAAIIEELWEKASENTVWPVTAFLRYGSEEGLQKTFLKNLPEEWTAGSRLSPFSAFVVEGLGLSPAKSALTWAATATKSWKYYSPIAKYIRTRFGEPPLDARLHDGFERDAEGRVILTEGNPSLVADIGPGLRPFIVNTETGKTWQRLPQKLSISAAEREHMTSEWETLTGFLKELKMQLDEAAFELYWKGESVSASSFLEWFRNPLTASAYEGVIWTNGDDDFAFVNGAFIDRQGAPYEPAAQGEVRPGHILSEGKDKMEEWKRLFGSLEVSPWMVQLAEPLYDRASLSDKRYRDMTVRGMNIRSRALSHFFLESMEALRRDNCQISFINGRYASELELLDLRIRKIGRRENLVLYLLDQLTAAEQIQRGNLTALPALASVTNMKLKNLIKTAQDCKQTAFTAALLEIQNDRKKGRRLSDEFSI